MTTNHIILDPWHSIRVRSYIFCNINKPFSGIQDNSNFRTTIRKASGLDDYDESQYNACSRKGLVGLLLSIWTGARERFESWACSIILPYHRIKRGERLNAFVDPCLIRWWKAEVQKCISEKSILTRKYLHIQNILDANVYQLGIIVSTADWNRQICFDNIASLLGSPICHSTRMCVVLTIL